MASILGVGVEFHGMKLLELEERMVVDMSDWRRRIHVLDRVETFYVMVHIADPKLLGLRLVGLVEFHGISVNGFFFFYPFHD